MIHLVVELQAHLDLAGLAEGFLQDPAVQLVELFRVDQVVALDARLGLGPDAVAAAMGDPATFVGNAAAQVAGFVAAVGELAARYPDAAGYQGGDIL